MGVPEACLLVSLYDAVTTSPVLLSCAVPSLALRVEYRNGCVVVSNLLS